MKKNLKATPRVAPFGTLILLFAALGCANAALAQGGGRGAAGPAGGPAPLAGGRFKVYPQEAIDHGLTAYNTTCGYCHGARGKGGNAGPDLITSDVSLHDEDGAGIAEFLKSAAHQKVVKLDLAQPMVYDIASYIHSRVIVAAITREEAHPDEVLKAGDAKAGEAYFNGAGGCAKCHSVTGNLKGVGAKYDPIALQDRMVNPRGGGGGGRGRGGAVAAPNPNAITATVTLPGGKTFQGLPLRVTDFDVTLRLDDGSTQTWARDDGIPKVELHDPLAAHVEIMKKLKDADMHNLTAYLATAK